MKPQIISQYDSAHQFEPLLPRESLLQPLLEKGSDLARAGVALASSLSASPRSDIRALLRSMNSYYTNRMEGDSTRPSEIEAALQRKFSADTDLARKQRLAVAHIETELELESEVDRRRAAGEDVVSWLYTTEALELMHLKLFGGLTEVDLRLVDGSLLVPGQVRTRGVAVGVHEAPTAASLHLFLGRWTSFYQRQRRGDAAVTAAAAAHHRLAWIHPFEDGNGRVARLQQHLLFYAMGIADGLWSPLRGFARSEERYKGLLRAADEHRHGDMDGRGNLTEKGLIAWMDYVLDTCLDQVAFMRQQLKLDGMRERLAAALTFEEAHLKTGVRIEALGVLHYLFMTQMELPRAAFKDMMNLGDRTATSTLSALLKQGYLATDSPYGPVRFAIPRHALRFLLPALWPEAEQDAEQMAAARKEVTAIPAARAKATPSSR